MYLRMIPIVFFFSVLINIKDYIVTVLSNEADSIIHLLLKLRDPLFTLCGILDLLSNI